MHRYLYIMYANIRRHMNMLPYLVITNLVLDCTLHFYCALILSKQDNFFPYLQLLGLIHLLTVWACN